MRAAVQITGRPSCTEAMPPQAAAKSPVSCRFSSGVHGEWSLTTQVIRPSASAAQSRSALAASRIGGQHLNSVAPAGIAAASRVR